MKYDNVLRNVDLTYQLVGNDIKENIVLNKADSAGVFEFTLECGKLTASLEKNQILLKNSKDKVVSTITAPYMVDALDKYSSDVKIELTSNKKSGSYTVKLIPDEDWLNAEERAYPVIIDPTITMTYNINNVDNTSVTSNRPASSEMYHYGVMYVGREASEYEKLRGLFKFTLPSQITESDMIIDAFITLTQRNYFGSGSVVVNAHKMTSDIALSSATWNNINGNYNTNVLDTQTVSSSTKGNHIKFDITAAVREWYLSGNNYGLALVSENETGAYKYATFYSARYPNIATDNLPALTVTYRNNDGIEDYLTYHEMGSDSMGTAYVGDFNGNMVYTYDDVSTDGNYMPLTVSHVYNHSQRDKANLMGGDMRFGYGMRLNLSQRIQTAGITGYSYKWTDADGTVHYFVQNGDNPNLHEEEFNTGRTITVQSDNTFKLNDGGMEDYIFTSSGYLKRINDTSNGKNIVITYNGTKITKVKDGAGRETVFAYNSNNYLTSITDPAGRSTSYTYSGGYLTGITKPDNTSISYTYATDGTKKILTRITDTDGSAVGFEYFAYAPRRVKTVTEYGTSSGQGNKLTYTYNAGETKITDINNRSETMMFDNYSHTVCVRDGEGNAVYGSYNNTSDNKQNTLKYQSDMQSTVTNYLLNHDFEYSALSPWENYSNAAQGTGTVSLSTAQKYMGNKSMQVKSTSSSGRYGYMQPLTLEGVAGSTYTFSTFVKITDITAASSGNSGLMIAFSYKDTNGSWHLGRRSFIKNTCDWQRVSHTITFPENLYNNYFRIVLGFENATGTAYFDSCQLEESAVVNRYNLLENGHFKEASGSNSVSCWTGQNLNTSSDKTVTGRIGRGYKIIGESKYKNIEQTLNISGNEGETFVFGAWGKANAIAKHNKNGGNARDFAVRITFNNSDSTVTKYYFDFEAKTANWQYLSGSVSAPQNYTGIKIALLYNNQRNYAVFDDVQLYHETFGTKYTYYGSGRISSETDSMGQKIAYAYWNATSMDLRSVTYYDSDGGLVGTETYQYDNDMNMTSSTDINGLTTTYHYDENGNLTDAEQTADGTKITSGETESGNYVSSSTDNLGHTVTYDYNPNTGVLNSVTDAKGTETNYTYNPNNDRLLTVTTGGSTNTYTYSGNHVSSITHNINANGTTNVTYNFVYDQFGNVTNVKVGNASLMSYQYGANNGNLTRSTYGNGDYVENVYDNLDRVKAVKYNGVEKFRWAYGANGSVGLHTDLVNGVKWQYDYNLNGDVTSVVGNNGTSFRYNYRSDGVLAGDTVTVGGVSKTTAYTNTTQGVLTQIQYGNNAKLHYTYDGFSRVTGTALGTNVSSPVLATSYSYLPAATAGETTDVVSSLTNTWQNGSLALHYTYDANGNILTIKEGTTQKVKYYYDALNQVTRENNAWLNKTIAYTYDNGGNIQTVKEYALTSGALDGLTAINTYTYLYGDSNWKDKLTSYNGHTIAYDAIGNPTTYYNGTTFTWQNGRELAGLTTGEGTGVTYTYNSDGIRTQKTVTPAGSVETVTTDYTLEGDKVVYETNGTDTFWYYYDESGAPVSFEYNGTTYYYVKNLQGNIIAILNTSGEQVVEYKYDTWGKLVTITGSLASTVGAKNPYRYRGYRYDNETGLYYLQSRYYDPKIGRFINADSYTDTGDTVLSTNMFAYCENNAVNGIDPDGDDAIWLQDTDTLCGLGHTGLLLQDKNGTWWHFYWGADRSGSSGKSGDFNGCKKLKGFRFKNLSQLNSYLNSKKIYSQKYKAGIYFHGNFDASVRYAKALKSSYCLLYNNCMQVSIDVLMKGKFKKHNKKMKAILFLLRSEKIPNIAFAELISIPSLYKIQKIKKSNMRVL